MANKYQTTKCAIATAFLLKLDKDLLVITGSTNIDHIKESIDGEKVNLIKEDWYAIYKETGHKLP
jgi:predicted oxidoreductase